MKLHLPVLQNFDCQGCTNCCRAGWPIPVSREDRDRIEAQGWGGTLGATRLFERFDRGGAKYPYRLARRADGACVFLDDDGRCRIHKKFGGHAKPLACRLYPLVIVPAEKGVAISIRYDCPSAAANRGTPLARQGRDIFPLAERVLGRSAESFEPPYVSRSQLLHWDELRRIVEAADGLAADQTLPPLHRLVAIARFCELLGQASFKKVRDRKIGELIDVLIPVCLDQAGQMLAEGRPAPPRRARKLMRHLLFAYGWRAGGPSRTWMEMLRRHWKQIRTARRFSKAVGPVPRLSEDWPDVTFEALDRPAAPADDDAAEPAIRAMRVRLDTMAFCGPAYYDYPLIDGLAALVLSQAAIGWYARMATLRRGGDRIVRDDVLWALRLVDHNYATAPLFGRRSERWRIFSLMVDENVAPLAGWAGV